MITIMMMLMANDDGAYNGDKGKENNNLDNLQ